MVTSWVTALQTPSQKVRGLQLNPNETKSEEFKVNVYPNPSESGFTVQANNADACPLEIKVMNAQGQITKYFEATENTIRFGHDLKLVCTSLK